MLKLVNSKRNKPIVLVIVLLFLGFQESSYGQASLSDKIVDTRPIELYLEVVNSIRKSGKPSVEALKNYFNNPTVSLFKQNPDFDSLKFLNNLITVYSNETFDQSKIVKSKDYDLMQRYKDNEAMIRKSIVKINHTNIDNLVKKRLKPFLSQSFDMDAVSLKYIYLFTEEGNGGFPGYVFNSALQTAQLKSKDIDVISAHEAYHAITGVIFMNKYKRVFEQAPSDTSANDQNLLWYLELVAEEGVADLIDKPILSSSNTPISKEIAKLRVNEKLRSAQKIHQLDSLLSTADSQLNFLNLQSIFENGGHIPGRFMGLQLKKGNLLNEFVKHTGNPFKFIFLYNEAVKNDDKAPRFSNKSILYLKKLESRLTKGL